MARRPTSRGPYGLALVRLVAGALVLQQGWRWLGEGGFFDGDAVRDAVAGSTGTLPGVLAWYGDTLVLANPDASAFLWRWGALLVGLSFVLGAFVRASGWLGVFFALHGLAFGPADATRLFVLLGAVLLACAVADGGHVLGLDRSLERHVPGWLTRRTRAPSPF